MGTGYFPRVKRQGRGGDHPPPSSYTSTPLLGLLYGELYLYLYEKRCPFQTLMDVCHDWIRVTSNVNPGENL